MTSGITRDGLDELRRKTDDPFSLNIRMNIFVCLVKAAVGWLPIWMTGGHHRMS